MEVIFITGMTSTIFDAEGVTDNNRQETIYSISDSDKKFALFYGGVKISKGQVSINRFTNLFL